MRAWIFALALCACSSSKSKDAPAPAKDAAAAPAPSGPATYQVVPLGETTSVTVTMETPAAWKVEVDPNGPSFKTEGVHLLTLAALDLPMATAIEMQFGEDSKPERAELSGGRVWMSETQANGTFHVRMFVPYEGGTLMGVAIVRDDSAALIPGLRKVFETLAPVTPR